MKHVLLLIAAGSIASAVVAQDFVDQFPDNLNWQTMSLLAFNVRYSGYEGTQGERDIAWAIWGSTIEAYPTKFRSEGNKWPSFILLKGFEDGTHRYIFTSMSAAAHAYASCTDAINSKNPDTPIYTKCPMRVVVESKRTGASNTTDYDDFCHISVNSREQPKTRNYEQVAVDSKTKIAYFRVIQYGKLAPECNRAVKLPGSS